MSRYELESDLGQFLDGYLGQDWDVMFPDAWSAVEVYVGGEPLTMRMVARAQLADVLRDFRTEAELSKAMDRVYMDYHPPADGMTYRQFLGKVERYLADHET